MYFIRAKTAKDDIGNPLYWSNQFGWTTMHDADEFSPVERDKMNLPLGGEWVEFLTRFLSGIASSVTERGEAVAFRFCATPDIKSLCIQMAEFKVENDFVDDSDIEDIAEDAWVWPPESRIDEAQTTVLEQIKTTDQPYEAYGINEAPDWARQLAE